MTKDLKTTDTLQQSGSDLKEALQHDAYELGGKIKERVSEGQEYAKNYLHSLEDTAKANPLLTIGTSFLVGIVASKLFCSSK